MMHSQSKPHLNPKKLLLSKWTAVMPVNREKHFVVTRVVEPTPPEDAIAFIEIQAMRTHIAASH